MLVGVSINNDNGETVSSVEYSGLPLTLVGAVNHQGAARTTPVLNSGQ